MSFSHLTLATRDVERTTVFFEQTFGFRRNRVPDNVPMDSLWLDIGRGQEMHLVFVDDFETGRFESEFGRHVALFHPLPDFAALRQRLADQGAEIIEPLRSTPFERFF